MPLRSYQATVRFVLRGYPQGPGIPGPCYGRREHHVYVDVDRKAKRRGHWPVLAPVALDGGLVFATVATVDAILISVPVFCPVLGIAGLWSECLTMAFRIPRYATGTVGIVVDTADAHE